MEGKKLAEKIQWTNEGKYIVPGIRPFLSRVSRKVADPIALLQSFRVPRSSLGDRPT